MDCIPEGATEKLQEWYYGVDYKIVHAWVKENEELVMACIKVDNELHFPRLWKKSHGDGWELSLDNIERLDHDRPYRPYG